MNKKATAILKSLFFDYWKNIVIVVLLFFLFRSCQGNESATQTVKVIVPEVKGTFKAKKPVNESILNKAKSPQLKKGETVYKENPINKKLIAENEKLKKDFAKADSTTKDVIFEKAATLNKFSSNFEDENIIINIDGIVQGEVKEITPNYKIKEKKIEVPVKVKETVFRLLAGGAIGLNKELNQAAYQLDLNFQNRKGNMFSAEYLKIGSQEFGMIGYKHSIINIKR